MSRAGAETVAGILVLVLLGALAYPAVGLGERDLRGGGGYRVVTQFDTVGGLQPGAPVEIAGVTVGQVERVRLDRRYYADITMRIQSGVVLHDDAVAAIKSTALTGEGHVSITPGASPKIVREGGRLRKTKDAINLQDVIAQFIQGKV